MIHRLSTYLLENCLLITSRCTLKALLLATALLFSPLSQFSFSPLLLITALILSSLSQLSCSLHCHSSPKLSFSSQLSSLPPHPTSPLLLTSFCCLIPYFPQLPYISYLSQLSSFPQVPRHLPASSPACLVACLFCRDTCPLLLIPCRPGSVSCSSTVRCGSRPPPHPGPSPAAPV